MEAPSNSLSDKIDQYQMALDREKTRLMQEINERGELHLQYLSLLEQQEALLSSIPAYIYIKNPQNQVVVANTAFLTLMDLPLNALPLDISTSGKDHGYENLLQEDLEIMAQNKTVTLEERTCKENTTQKSWFWVSKTPFFSPGGQLLGLVGSFVDISEIKKAQLALQQSEMIFRTLAERSFSAIFILQIGQLLYVNPLFRSSFSLPDEKPLPQIDLFSLFIDEDSQKLKKKCQAIEHEGLNSSRFQVSAHPLDRAGVLIFEIYLTQIDYHGQTAVLGSLLDITDKYLSAMSLEEKANELESLNQGLEKKIEKEIEQRLQNEQLMLHQSRLAAMGEMIDAIAHQWRQPLTTLSIMIQNLENAFAFNRVDENQINRFIDESHFHIRRMTESIDQFGRFFASHHEETPPPTWFSLLHDVVLIYANSYPNAPLGLSISPELKEYRCYAQINAFKQVMISLLNLMTLTRQPLDSRAGFVSLSAEMVHDAIHVRLVSDQKPAEFPLTFPSNHFAITLTMCKKLVEEHMQGKFSYQDDDDAALVFFLVFPLK